MRSGGTTPEEKFFSKSLRVWRKGVVMLCVNLKTFLKTAAMPYFLLPFWLGGLVVASHAAELTPAEAEQRALRHNPDVKAARLRIDEAKGRLRQAGLRPNPELQVEAEHNARFREGSLSVGWVQKFPKSSKLQLEKDVSQAMLDAAMAEVLVAERALVLQVRGLAVKLQALRAQDDLRKKQLANAAELVSAAAKRAERGEGSPLEAAQFELETQQLSLDALEANTLRAQAAGELRSLLAIPPDEEVGIKGELVAPNMPKALTTAEARPEYDVATRQLTAAQRAVELEKARRRDDISGGLFAGIERTEDAPEGFGNDGIIGIRLSIPVPFWNKNEGKIQEAESTAARLESEKQALVQRITAENATAKDRLQSLARMISEIDATLLPKAEELEKKLREAYDKGMLPNTTDVLRAREKRLQFERTRLEALRDFHLLRASMGLSEIGEIGARP